jgi:hypothetical protein
MKRYLVFGCSAYYPAGGMDDYIAGFDSREEAESFARYLTEGEKSFDWSYCQDMQEHVPDALPQLIEKWKYKSGYK